jgi:hypothetical protein
MIGHRMVGTSMLFTGHLTQGRAHLDQAIALYNPAAHRPLAMRFNQDDLVSSLIRRSQALWSLGYPDAALVDVDRALKEAREIGHVASLAFALSAQCWLHVDRGNYGVADRLVDELLDLADDKGVVFWKAGAIVCRGWLFSLTGKALEAVKMTSSGLTALRSAGASLPARDRAFRASLISLSSLACSRPQLIQQGFGLFEVERVEAFGEPAVDRSEQIAGLIQFALITPEPRHAHCGAEFPGFRLLLTGNRKRVVKKLLRFCNDWPRQHQCDFTSKAINLRLVKLFPRSLHRRYRFTNAAPSVIELAELRVGFGEVF